MRHCRRDGASRQWQKPFQAGSGRGGVLVCCLSERTNSFSPSRPSRVQLRLQVGTRALTAARPDPSFLSRHFSLQAERISHSETPVTFLRGGERVAAVAVHAPDEAGPERPALYLACSWCSAVQLMPSFHRLGRRASRSVRWHLGCGDAGGGPEFHETPLPGWSTTASPAPHRMLLEAPLLQARGTCGIQDAVICRALRVSLVLGSPHPQSSLRRAVPTPARPWRERGF